jgi:hypothetical protein
MACRTEGNRRNYPQGRSRSIPPCFLARPLRLRLVGYHYPGFTALGSDGSRGPLVVGGRAATDLLGNRIPILYHPGRLGEDRSTGSLHVRHDPVVGSPPFGREAAVDVAALVVEEAYVRVLLQDHSPISRLRPAEVS